MPRTFCSNFFRPRTARCGALRARRPAHSQLRASLTSGLAGRVHTGATLQPLVPVVATLLHLSADEARQLREAVAAQTVAVELPGTTLSNWLAFS